MSTEGWIFMVGFRIFDVGLLVLWLVWFFRLRDDGSQPDADDDPGGGGGPEPPLEPLPGPGGKRLAIAPAAARIRDHAPRRGARVRRPSPPAPLPARVRRPRSPVPATRRAESA